MDRLRFHRVEMLFDAASEVPPAEREAFLRRARAGEDDLLLEIRRLLESADRPLEIDGAPRPAGAIEDLAPGTEIGAYEIIDTLGEGGFGVVYGARQERPVRRDVALKILKRGMDSRQILARFEAEREALGRMDHPHIAHVLDAGVSADGRPYFVMDLVRGPAITDFCDERRLATPERLELWLQVCAAIAHAHRKGIVHRDLKPSNVLVSTEGGIARARVIDFGIARAMGDGSPGGARVTQPDQPIGTPAYMSPEQAAGSLDVDTRADVYALGVLLYELMTGTTPHEPPGSGTSSPQQIRRRIGEHEPPRPSSRLSELGALASTAADARRTDLAGLRRIVRGDLDWIVMKAIEKDADRRYATAEALAADVQRFLRREPVEAGPPGAGYRLRKLVSRHRIAVGAAVCVALAVLGGAALSTAGFVSAARERDLAHERLYDAYLAQITQLRAGRQRGRRAESLRIVAEAAQLRPSPDLREQAIACLTLADLELERRIPVTLAPGASPTTRGLRTPDQFAKAMPDGVVVVRDLNDGAVLARLRGPAETPWGLVFSPAGTYLAVKHHEDSTVHLVVWDVAAAQLVVLMRDIHNVLGATIVFAADESWIAFGGPGDRVQRLALPSGEPMADIGLEGRPVALAVSPTTPRLAVAVAGETTLSIFDTDRDTLAHTVATPSAIDALTFSRDGRRIATAAATGELAVWESATGRLLATLHGHQGRPRRLEFDATGERLVSSAWDSTTRLWNVDGGAEAIEPFRGWQIVGFNKTLLLTDRREIAIWRDTTSPVWRTLALSGDQGEVPALAVAPDSRVAAVAGENGVRLCDLWAGTEIGRLLPDVNTYSVMFDAAGDLLAATDTGVTAWTTRRSDDALVVGAPRKVISTRGVTRAGLDVNGRRLAVCDSSETRVVNLDDPARSVRVAEGGAWGTRPSVSPDGRWLFTGTWKGPPAKLWDAERLEVVRTYEGISVAGQFDPTGRYLVVAQESTYRLLEVGTWTERWSVTRDIPSRLTGPIAFDPGGGLAALAVTADSIALVSLDRLTIVAVLPNPRGERVKALAFTPDGSTLLAASRAHAPLQTWDLHRLRAELKRLGLDWESASSTEPTSPPASAPLRFETADGSADPVVDG